MADILDQLGTDIPDLESTQVPSAEASFDPLIVTDWLVEPRANASLPCPLGFVCDETRQANCTNIRAVSLAYGFGDVHAGGFCPEGEDSLRLCPAGHFCPTAERLELCPSGFFCPHKTSIPEIVCQGCDAGAITLIRETYGYILIALSFVAALVWIILTQVRRHRSDLVKRVQELSSRSMDTARTIVRRKQRQQALERLKPKLFSIQQRLEASLPGKVAGEQSGGSVISLPSSSIGTSPSQEANSNSEAISIHESGKIKYNARQLFDMLDVNQDGKLSYQELQLVLGLKEEQLTEFIRRMNELDDVKSQTEVSRACFARHFLKVLEETTYFGPTPEEVEDLWKELATKNEPCLLYASLYDSQLSLFLTDPQIHQLISLFRKAAQHGLDHGRSLHQSRRVVEAEEAPMDGSSELLTKSTERQSSTWAVTNLFSTGDAKRYLHRDDFIQYYSTFLLEVTTTEEEKAAIQDSSLTKGAGVDLAFDDLCLTVQVGDQAINVVNHISGRLQASTMTALMGGSGAGKTSLLNALCGRAFYGTTSGTIRINGHVASIEEHKSATGFVPQSDDSVHAELTVRENLIYSGRFSLPKGTSIDEVENYADEVMANLGLSRVADSIVGNVNRRGVSGGEKKRVNIGIELMAKPSILFLDEPTSGLDSSSALLVMGSLKNLVKSEGMTICSVIHQPRKQIFDNFDSLLLLGVGGNMVYHGPVGRAKSYFESLANPYFLPGGESLADWLIDVSSGRLLPSESPNSLNEQEDVPEEPEGDIRRETSSVVSSRGPSTAKFDEALENDKERRQGLYDCWKNHFDKLSRKKRAKYDPPKPYPLPLSVDKPPFFRQLWIQLGRNFLIMWRNRTSKLIDTTMIVGAVVLISWLEGVSTITTSAEPNITFDQLVEGDPFEIPKTFPSLFRYALGGTSSAVEFSLKIGVITSVLLGLTAAKALTSKRLEFFRESGSGWNINAYFLAVNLTSTLEHFVQMSLAAGCAYWLRDSMTTWYTYQVQFIMLMWLVVSWSMFLPLLVPPNNVVLVVGFFMAFFGLLFSGGIDPVVYRDVYEDEHGAMALFSGIVSAPRYFIEAMAAQELRCLPQQSGFTVEPTSVNFPIDMVGSFHLVGLGQNDLSVVQRSCHGWYWGVLPAFVVGIMVRVLALGTLHVSDRSRQNKKPLMYELRKEPIFGNRPFHYCLAFICTMVVLFILSAFLILGERGDAGIASPPESREEALDLLNQTLKNLFRDSGGALSEDESSFLESNVTAILG